MHRRLLARLHANADFLARLHEEARDVHRLAVHLDVAVANELARRLAARREAHAVDDVVETALERGEKVVARDARQRRDALERVAELLLAHAVDALDLLLLTQLLRVLRRLAAAGRALRRAGRGRTDDARPGTSR